MKCFLFCKLQMLLLRAPNLLTRGSALCCPVLQHSLPAHSNDRLGYCGEYSQELTVEPAATNTYIHRYYEKTVKVFPLSDRS